MATPFPWLRHNTIVWALAHFYVRPSEMFTMMQVPEFAGAWCPMDTSVNAPGDFYTHAQNDPEPDSALKLK